MKDFSLGLLAISGCAAITAASPTYLKNFMHGTMPVAVKSNLLQSSSQNTTGPCSSGTLSTTKAPLQNIFAALTGDEAAAVTKFLHEQPELNLTANANATRYATDYATIPDCSAEMILAGIM